jgi:hypothetical protein
MMMMYGSFTLFINDRKNYVQQQYLGIELAGVLYL